MRIVIIGSRGYPVGASIGNMPGPVDRVRSFVRSLPPGTTVISGAARGVDRTAEEEARLLGLPVESYPADWNSHGKKAGFLRNRILVEEGDAIEAFWDGSSSGTLSTINLANAARKPVRIHRIGAQS